MGWMDVVEASKQPSILKTSEGWFLCWLDGTTASGDAGSLERALRMMYRLLHPVERSGGPTLCPGTGKYVPDSAIKGDLYRTVICPDCDEYSSVEGNKIAFHIV